VELEFLGDSSCVRSAGYQNGFLTIEFQDGSIYTYEDVEPSTYGAFKRSVSKGWYFNKRIRNNYSFYEGYAPDNMITDTATKILDQIME